MRGGELAVARIRLLDPAALLDGLAASLDALGVGAVDLLDRQRNRASDRRVRAWPPGNCEPQWVGDRQDTKSTRWAFLSGRVQPPLRVCDRPRGDGRQGRRDGCQGRLQPHGAGHDLEVPRP